MKKITIPVKEELNNLYIEQHYTISQLADHYKCSTKTIKKWLKEYTLGKSKEERLQSARDACLRKYGVPTPFESKSIQDKAQSTLHIQVYSDALRMQHIQKKREDTWKILYGVKNPSQLEDIKNKKCQTSRRNCGKDYYTQTEEYKKRARQTNIERRGVPYPMQSDEVKKKSRYTCLFNYGEDNYAKTQESKNRYKNTDYVKGIVNKQTLTRKQNHSFKVSKPEDLCYQMLLTKFTEEEVIRQYTTEEYPFNCDLYIKPLNLYIECNFFWMHGGEPFDKNNPKHIEKLNLWKAKNSKSFNNAIDTWARRDVLKLETFKKNKLNYKVFYKFLDFKKWFVTLGSKVIC